MARPLLAIVTLCTLLCACQQMQSTDSGTVGVTRTQRMSYLIPEDQVLRTADEAYGATLDKDLDAGILNTDPQLSGRVERITYRLIHQVGTFRQDATLWHWEVNVETNDTFAAYCAPGGKVLVDSGVVTTLSLSDDELAALLAHEIAHALRNHMREKLSMAQLPTMAAQMVNAATGGKHQDAIAGALKLADQAYNSPFSPVQEGEADAMGLELAARAGFDPAAAVTLWLKIEQTKAPSGPSFLNLHPTTDARITAIQALLPKVQPLYDGARQSR